MCAAILILSSTLCVKAYNTAYMQYLYAEPKD